MAAFLLHTQSNLWPGNCWQTAIASVLGLPAESLPDQVRCELFSKSNGGSAYYSYVVRAYLDKHHGLSLAYLHGEHLIAALRMRTPGLHLVEGPTVRTPHNGGVEHVCVGLDGELVWDVHPSRAGLTRIDRWGLFIPAPAHERERRAQLAKSKPGTDDWLNNTCHCPDCCGQCAMCTFAVPPVVPPAMTA